MAKKITLSSIKADIGSIGGHTQPAESMMKQAIQCMKQAIEKSLIIDGLATFTGDDINLLMSHTHGINATVVHTYAWGCFKDLTKIAQKYGLYGAGQDLLVDAPAGTVRGAGPAVAEIEFDRDPDSKDRRAEAFLIFAADKCSPGAYNLPFYLVFCDPNHCGGLLLSPKMHKGFIIEIIDMDYKSKDADRIIQLSVPERAWDVVALLHDINRFAIKAIYSRYKQDEHVVSVSADRLHNIAGTYTGKDDPVAIVRTQGIFPAPEEVVGPFSETFYVTGDARGSHTMPLMPVAINTPVTGKYCIPVVSCCAFSMDKDGKFGGLSSSHSYVDMFGQVYWDKARLQAQEQAEFMRKHGAFGVAMAEKTELSYTGLEDTLKALDKEFKVKKHT